MGGLPKSACLPPHCPQLLPLAAVPARFLGAEAPGEVAGKAGVDPVSGGGPERPENRSVGGRKGGVPGQTAPVPARNRLSRPAPPATRLPASHRLHRWLLPERWGLVGKDQDQRLDL